MGIVMLEMKAVVLSLLPVVLAASPHHAISESSWELVAHDDGVEVYTRQKAGSEYRAFKSTVTVDATAAEIVDVLKDVDSYVNWFAFTEHAELLRVTPVEQFTYVETYFPWPLSNEDMIYRMTYVTLGEAATKLLLEGIPDYLPSRSGITRMKSASGYISLDSTANETKITYSMHLELGGSIPIWMANGSIHELPLRTLSNLKRHFEAR